MVKICVDKAGWSLRRGHQPRFPEGDSHLVRYAHALPAVEINSSFRKWHRASTYERWGNSVPEQFRFAVKIHQVVTHKGRLEDWEPMACFLDDTTNLGQRLGVYLVQLSPSPGFQTVRTGGFFKHLRQTTAADTGCELRHASWFW